MATALDLLNRAALSLGVKHSGEALSPSEASDMLALLQDMLDGWSTEHFTVYAVTTDQFPLTFGQDTYTYGTGGDFNASRPQSILSAYLRDSDGHDSPLEVTYRERYNVIVDKGSLSRPYQLYWVPSHPLATVFFDSSPDAVYTVIIDALKPLDKHTTLTETISFPPGYDRAIRYNLAVEAAPMFGMDAPATVAALADRSLRALKRQNLRVPVLTTEIASSGRYNIYTDS